MHLLFAMTLSTYRTSGGSKWFISAMLPKEMERKPVERSALVTRRCLGLSGQCSAVQRRVAGGMIELADMLKRHNRLWRIFSFAYYRCAFRGDTRQIRIFSSRPSATPFRLQLLQSVSGLQFDCSLLIDTGPMFNYSACTKRL